MAGFHYVQLRAFAHETEDPERVRLALRQAAQSETLPISETTVDGSHKNRILILEAEVKNAAGIRRLFEAFARSDPSGYRRVVDEVERRFDENLNFYLRLDKQEAYQGRLVLAVGDDAITVRAKVKSYQSKKSEGVQDDARRDLESFLTKVTDRVEPDLNGKATTFKAKTTFGPVEVPRWT